MPVSGRVSGIKEWDEGFEALRVIPHSFAVELKGAEPAWLFYVETAEEKVSLLDVCVYFGLLLTTNRKRSLLYWMVYESSAYLYIYDTPGLVDQELCIHPVFCMYSPCSMYVGHRT